MTMKHPYFYYRFNDKDLEIQFEQAVDQYITPLLSSAYKGHVKIFVSYINAKSFINTKGMLIAGMLNEFINFGISKPNQTVRMAYVFQSILDKSNGKELRTFMTECYKLTDYLEEAKAEAELDKRNDWNIVYYSHYN